jgi:DNA-binding transcriptional MerR regulator/methylmalonyl-CoA mutase cobalamin-binding subunit
MYSIKAVARATGLTVETLRAWERRYGVVHPVRDGSGRRVYRPEDVLRLRRLREATERGHPISRLAPLSEERLSALLDAPGSEREQGMGQAFVGRILDAALQFRADECEQAITLAVGMLPPERLVSDVLQPLLLEVGNRWHRGEFAISQERLITKIVSRHVRLMLYAFERTARREAVVFATLPGERHELGLLMSAMLCASRGFKVHYLGTDLPAEEIARFAKEVGASVVALSIVLHDRAAELPAQLTALAAGLPEGTAIWIGGSGASRLAGQRLPESCELLRDSAEFEQRLELRSH